MEERPAQPDWRHADQFLIEEYKHFADLFWKNESAGDSRVNFLITLVTAVLTALVALLTSAKSSVEEHSLRLFAAYALVALLLLGLITFMRVLHRNRVTDEYKDIMNSIRGHFQQFGRWPEGYPPFARDAPLRLFRGGLAVFVGLLNSFVAAALAVLCSLPPEWSGKIPLTTRSVEVITRNALISFFVSLGIYSLFIVWPDIRQWSRRQRDRRRIDSSGDT